MTTAPSRRRAMKVVAGTAALAIALAPSSGAAQSAPVITALREYAATMSRNLAAAADVMPEGSYAFKPTPAQRSFGDVLVHLAEGNDAMCDAFGPVKAPARTTVPVTAGKDALIARLKETFAFCDVVLAGAGDANVGEKVAFGSEMKTRAEIETYIVGDWADHYSQLAIYLRLNGLLPPTARKPGG